MAAELARVVDRLERVASRLEGLADARPAAGGSSGGSAPAGPEKLASFVVAFDDILNGVLAKFLSLSADIGTEVKTQAAIVKEAFDTQRDFLVKVSKCKNPGPEHMMKLLLPTSEKLQAIQEYREQHRRNELFNHLSAVSESVPALGWVTVSPAPAPFVKEMADAGQFFSNRVLKDYKEKDKTHVEWARAWITTLTDLQAYVKQHHTTGIEWNKQGVAVSDSVDASPAPAPPTGPPAPPPPGPPPPPAAMAAQPAEDDTKRNALFADLNKGADVTKGLRKVSDDMKTHKNTNLRLQTPTPYKPQISPKPFKAFNKPGASPKAEAAAKPPKIELEGKKWIVEYHQGNRNIVLDDTSKKQSVYIFRCQESTIQVKGKVNAIILDNCKKTAVVFDDVIASVDFINCQSVQAQVVNKVPTVNIDKTDGCMVYLSKDSLDVDIVSAKSSEMNILVPDESGEFKEFALPEQYKSKWDGTRMCTEPTDIAG